jgi:hypothetical protein
VGVAYWRCISTTIQKSKKVHGGEWRGCRTFLVPLIHAGWATFARRGMVAADEADICVREAQLSGVLVNVRRDMCGDWQEKRGDEATFDAPLQTSGIRDRED